MTMKQNHHKSKKLIPKISGEITSERFFREDKYSIDSLVRQLLLSIHISSYRDLIKRSKVREYIED